MSKRNITQDDMLNSILFFGMNQNAFVKTLQHLVKRVNDLEQEVKELKDITPTKRKYVKKVEQNSKFQRSYQKRYVVSKTIKVS